MADFDLTNIDGLLGAVAEWEQRRRRAAGAVLETTVGLASEAPAPMQAGELLGDFTGTPCTSCNDLRRMELRAADNRCNKLTPANLRRTSQTLQQLEVDFDSRALAVGAPPPVFTATCLQCRSMLSLVVAAGPPTEVIVLGDRFGGLATSHTPEPVRFFLDQAYRARTAGAHTAALAMYRAALEQFLRHGGFAARTLKDSIEQAVKVEPAWMGSLDAALMHALRRLGNTAVHAAPAGEAAQDRALVHDAELVFIDVLDEAFELPARREARRGRILGDLKAEAD